MLTIAKLNRIRNPKSLAALKKVFTDFLNLQRDEAVKVYESMGWGEEDLDADTEVVNYWIERIDHRVESLAGYLAKADKNSTHTAGSVEERSEIVSKNSCVYLYLPSLS